MPLKMGRRELIAALGSAAAWPLAARAQRPRLPVIGFVNSSSPDLWVPFVRAWHQGLSETGYAEGRNTGAFDPVKLGLVASLARPGGNMTGVTQLTIEVGPKRLELMHELLPAASTMALLVNPNSVIAETEQRNLEATAHTLGVQLAVLNAGSEQDFDKVFASLIELRAGGLVIGSDPFFLGQSARLAALAQRHGMPAVFIDREFAVVGGLMSYGGDVADSYRIAGVYTGRILNGDKPADLPVQQSTKVELILNLKTAKELGITFPISLLGRADEVIE